MTLASKLNEKIEEFFFFYNPEGKETITLRHMLKQNSFLCYTKLLGFIWMPAYYGSAIASFFDNGKYNHEKILAMATTSPALITGTILFGAFWSKLGSFNLLKEAWKRDKLDTSIRILKNNCLGNIYYSYYILRVSEDAYHRTALNSLKRVYDQTPKLAKGLEDLAMAFGNTVR